MSEVLAAIAHAVSFVWAHLYTVAIGAAGGVVLLVAVMAIGHQIVSKRKRD